MITYLPACHTQFGMISFCTICTEYELKALLDSSECEALIRRRDSRENILQKKRHLEENVKKCLRITGARLTQGRYRVGARLAQGWRKVAPRLAQGKHRIVQVRKEFISQQYVPDANFKLASSIGQACCLSTCFKEVLFLVLWLSLTWIYPS